jgi:RimJ/RimL family protein N-acetyltransferase
VQAVRATEAAMKPARFGPSDDERASLTFRRSLLVARDVKRGAIVTSDDVRSVRPSHGLDPKHLPEILGRVATRDLAAGAPVTWDAFEERPARADLSLRAATADDEAMLLAWRNDPESRAMSRTTQAIDAKDHAAWLKKVLAANDRALYVATVAGESVGQARLDDLDAGSCEVSITIAPSRRGAGLATAVLVAIEGEARKRGAIRLVARIKPENGASMHAFKRAGYYGFAETTESGEKMIGCERRIVPYP